MIFIDSIAQNSTQLFRIVERGKFGFINNKGKIIIKPHFWFAGDFYNGLAAAKSDSGYGYIGYDGKFLINPVFDFAADFYDSSAFVVLNSKKYLINKRGKIKNYSDSAYTKIIHHFKETYSQCTDSNLITLEQNVKKGFNEFEGFQIINSKLGDTIFTYFQEVDRKFPSYACASCLVFRKDLMLVVNKGRISYADTLGNIVWEAVNPSPSPGRKLNLNFRVAQENNCTRLPNNMEKLGIVPFPPDTSYPIIKAYPNENIINSEGVVCMKVRLFNNSPYPDDTIYLHDTNVFFNLEIKNQHGKWIPFESACGICVSIIRPCMPDTLKKMVPGYFWTFHLPAYDGSHKATFRYKMEWSLSRLYSNEFEGKYNPYQLVNKGIWFSGNEIEKYFGPVQISHEFIPEKCGTYLQCGSMMKWRCYEDEN